MSEENYSFTITAENVGSRLDKAITELCENLSRNAVQRLLEEGNITVKGKNIDKNYRLKIGDEVSVTIPAPISSVIEPQNIELNIVYEDSDLLIVNKNKGMVVHPALGNRDGTLVNALLYHCSGSLSGINGVSRPGIVHRIDKDTSGLLIVAKNDHAHNFLAAQIKEHSFTRIYEAVVIGSIKVDSGKVDAPIGRHPIERKRMAVTDKNSRNAVTHYEVIADYSGYTHLKLHLETGRTHQIRVHMAYIGHPVLGDMVYGPSKLFKGLNGQCLHARTIGFIHPSTGEYMEFSSDLPEYFNNVLQILKAKN